MSNFFLGLALLFAILDWMAVSKKWKRLEYIAKPGVMAALLAFFWQMGGIRGHWAWFAAGIIFSMAGDIFLMLPREQFIAGLVSFLLAHLAYVMGFTDVLPKINLSSLIVILLVGFTAGQVYRSIASGLRHRGENQLQIPVLIYSAVISLMVLSALLTMMRGEWVPLAAYLASGGALLFFISDTFLAWNKFVTPLPYGNLRVIITYHLGQALIVLGVVVRFLFPG
jgi:uncharacterized membrane protein YhhN